MLRSLTLAAVLCGAALAPAQVVPVNNTGCPGFVPPVVQGQPRLGQTISFTVQRRPAPQGLALVLLGWPSGAGIAFNPPITCVAGPCVLYPAPINGSFFTVADPFMAVLTIPIPNDRMLLFQTFSVQGGTYDALGGACITLTQALSFAIQP
ncbi:MAG: hypothetical protein IPM29_25405 [Planctomycetes bacterium]|nr:hypothetical protein [Planctomycetota bacterium]